MSVITLEQGEEHEPTQCACCGNTTRTVHGFVYADGSARAVYFASWTIGHADAGVAMAIGIGEWGDGANPAQRRSFGLECRLTDEQIQFMVREPADSPWGSRAFLGKMLSRAAALADPEAAEVFRIAERVVADDARIAEFVTAA